MSMLVQNSVMAVLDSIHLILVVIAGAYVSPTLTVILVQTTIPFMTLFTIFFKPEAVNNTICCTIRQGEASRRNCSVRPSNEVSPGQSSGYVRGASIIFSATFLGLVPAFVALWNPSLFSFQDPSPR